MTPSPRIRAGRYAAMDLGTVTCRMLVADVDECGGLHELSRFYEIENLGDGVDASKTLRRDAIERAASTMGSYRNKLDELEAADGVPISLAAFATSAARDASNGDELLERLEQRRVPLRIIPGEKEANLSFAGASMDFAGEDLLVVDVGGGSTEVVAGKAGKGITCAHSFNVGCRRMTERFLKTDPPSSDELAAAAQWVRDEMAPYFSHLKQQGVAWSRLVAVAGTATTVVSVHERMETYDSSRVHGFIVDANTLREQLDSLAALPLEERRRVVGLDPNRAPVVVAGLVILGCVLELAGVSSYTASETDILQGVVMAQAQGLW